jgi:ribonuclease HI
MSVPPPHFLLFSESRSTGERTASRSAAQSGKWRFVLESVDGKEKLEAADEEGVSDPERLELLAVVRGLEALDQPSLVTLVTRRPSISRGFRFGLANWRESDWQWECYGRMTEVKDADLWQRVDRALDYHQVKCRTWRFDSPQEPTTTPRMRRRRPATGDAPSASRTTLWSRVGSLLKMPRRLGKQQEVES